MKTVTSQLIVDAQTWLTSTAKEVFVSQLVIFTIKLLQLSAQIASFWYFAIIMSTVVVEQKGIAFAELLPFITASMCWGVLSFLADVVVEKTQLEFEKTIEQRVHQALESKETALTRRFSLAYWQQLLLDNLNDVSRYHTQYSVQKWLSVTAPLIVLLVIFPINYIVAIALLVTMPIVPLFMILVGKGAASLHRKHFIALERLGSMFSDRLKALPLITASHQHSAQVKRLHDASSIVNRKTMQVVSVAFLSTSVLDFFSTISIALVAVFIGFSLIGEFNFGPEITLHLGLFMLLVSPLLFSELKTLGRFYHQKAKAEAGAERFAAVLTENVRPLQMQTFDGLNWLNYKIAIGTNELKASKIHISRGDWVLLTGASGTGKTLVLEALMGLVPASHQLQAKCTLLTQNTVILDKTLSQNLSLGRTDLTVESMLKVLDEVQLTPWLDSLPFGLQTIMGDYPSMSGGEAQRLALARVILQQHDIVLLDEPSAHLTQQQHALMSDLIYKKLKHKTVIWVSHKTLPQAWFSQHWHIANRQLEIMS